MYVQGNISLNARMQYEKTRARLRSAVALPMTDALYICSVHILSKSEYQVSIDLLRPGFYMYSRHDLLQKPECIFSRGEIRIINGIKQRYSK